MEPPAKPELPAQTHPIDLEHAVIPATVPPLHNRLDRDEDADETLVPEDEFEIEDAQLPASEENGGIIEKHSPRIFSRGVQLYCIAMLCGSLMKACSKLLVERVDIFVVLLCRMSVTTAISLVAMHHLKVEHYFWGHREIRVLLFIRGALGFFNIVCTYFALQYLSLPDLAVISFLTPLTSSIAARVFLGEQYRWQQALAGCVSLLGVVVISRPPWLFGTHALQPKEPAEGPIDPADQARWARLHTLAIVCSLAVVLTATAVTIILRKIKERAHALASVSNYGVFSVVGACVALAVRDSSTWSFPRTLRMWLLIGAMGIFGFMLQFLSSKAIQMEEATTLANFKYTQLFYAITLEFLVWHDVPDYISLLGMVLILGGVFWSARFKLRLR